MDMTETETAAAASEGEGEILTDERIAALIAERKLLEDDSLLTPRFKYKVGQKEFDIEVEGEHGSRFRITLRQNLKNAFDFTAILYWLPLETTRQFILYRYNGKHKHENKLENVIFRDYHIHKATERYQRFKGTKEEGYAETTHRYHDLMGAVGCLMEDCNLQVQEGQQQKLESFMK